MVVSLQHNLVRLPNTALMVWFKMVNSHSSYNMREAQMKSNSTVFSKTNKL